MKTDTINSDKYQSAFQRLHDFFEDDLIEELKTFPIAEFTGGAVVGKASDKADFVPLVLHGSMRTVRYDIYGNEVNIYDIYEMQSCIIGITAVLMPDIASGYTITNEDIAFIKIPKSRIIGWMKKYKSWLEFTFHLNEIRMNELVERNKEVSEKNKEINDSIRYAQRIQKAVLPSQESISRLLPKHFILFKPRDIVSGDYYWVTKIHHKTVVVVADCTGHGVPGALMSMLGISLLNKLFIEDEDISAARVLDKLRDDVITSLNDVDEMKSNSEKVKDGMDMAIMIFDFERHKMQYSGAYNPFYLVRNKELQHFKADRMPVGLFLEKNANFTNHEIDIQKDDIIYAFSDGYVDQIDESGSKKFLSKNFKNLLLEINDLSMEDQKKVLNSKIETWKGTHEQIDDILVMGIKI